MNIIMISWGQNPYALAKRTSQIMKIGQMVLHIFVD